MKTAWQILRYQLRDAARSRWIVAYGLLFLLLTEGLFWFGGGGERVVVSLVNAVLLLIPLVGLLFGALHFYHSRDFMELMLAQPVDRSVLYAGLYGGLALPLTLAFALGVGLPFAWHGGGGAALITLLGVGLALTLVFTGVAFLVALAFEDRAKGMGAALLLWLGAGIIWDGLVLLVVLLFGDYPLERPMLALTFLNPIDLSRVLLLIQLDIAALMGYTGAVFRHFFGSTAGVVAAAVAMLAWTAAPLWLGFRRFRRKDF
ncbi:MAG: ABC transporter permease subunit [Gemmatimonadota bacterium]